MVTSNIWLDTLISPRLLFAASNVSWSLFVFHRLQLVPFYVSSSLIGYRICFLLISDWLSALLSPHLWLVIVSTFSSSLIGYLLCILLISDWLSVLLSPSLWMTALKVSSMRTVLPCRCWAVLDIVPQTNSCFSYNVKHNNSMHTVTEAEGANTQPSRGVCFYNLSLER